MLMCVPSLPALCEDLLVCALPDWWKLHCLVPCCCCLVAMLLCLQDLPDLPEWELVFKTDGSVDRRRYNAPTAGEVAGFMPGGYEIGGFVCSQGGEQ